MQINEQIALTNHTTQEEVFLTLKSLSELSRVYDILRQTPNGSYELHYLSGELTGMAADCFLMSCELANYFNVSLTLVNKLVAVSDCFADVENLLTNETYVILTAKTPLLAFRQYLEVGGQLANIPLHLVDYLDFAKWYQDTSTIVAGTGVSSDSDGEEFVVYTLL